MNELTEAMQDGYDGHPLQLGDEVRVSGSRDRLFVIGFEPDRGRVELLGKRRWGSVDVRAVRWVPKGPKPKWAEPPKEYPHLRHFGEGGAA